MVRHVLGGVVLAGLFALPVLAQAPEGAEQTPNGTIIWKAPRNGDAQPPAPEPGKDTIIWNDDPKAAPPPKSAGVPDKNGIIWNDPPATAKATPSPAPAPQTAAAPPVAVEGQSGPCRAYDTEITIEGRRQPMRGTACRAPDGRWRVISQVPR